LTAVAGSTSLSLAEAQIAPGATCQIQRECNFQYPGRLPEQNSRWCDSGSAGCLEHCGCPGNLNAQAVGLFEVILSNHNSGGDISTLTITLRNPADTDYQDASH